VAGARNAAVQAKIPVTVKVGYHVNSNTPSDEYLIPLKLTWLSTGALEAGAVAYPKPSLEKYEFAEKPLSVYTGNFELVANFKVAANAPTGPGAAVGKLRYRPAATKPATSQKPSRSPFRTRCSNAGGLCRRSALIVSETARSPA